MRKPIKEIEIEGDDEAHTIMQVAQRLPPQCIIKYWKQYVNRGSNSSHKKSKSIT